jgi:hypothetical protein
VHQHPNRRQFLKQLAHVAGGVVLVPYVTSCGGTEETPAGEESAVPVERPDGWDSIAYNRERGNAGAIPESYRADINGPDGVTKHLGKHLPYVPQIDASLVPAGFLALMWGDPDKGYTRHPNAPKNDSNGQQGHWYNWIKLRLATEDEAEEVQSTYTNWPGTNPPDSGAYAVFGGGDVTADSGKNTIYLAALPQGARQGDTLRVWAHCLTHGEYVDFITL